MDGAAFVVSNSWQQSFELKLFPTVERPGQLSPYFTLIFKSLHSALRTARNFGAYGSKSGSRRVRRTDNPPTQHTTARATDRQPHTDRQRIPALFVWEFLGRSCLCATYAACTTLKLIQSQPPVSPRQATSPSLYLGCEIIPMMQRASPSFHMAHHLGKIMFLYPFLSRDFLFAHMCGASRAEPAGTISLPVQQTGLSSSRPTCRRSGRIKPNGTQCRKLR